MNPGPVDGPTPLNEKDDSSIMKKYIALLISMVGLLIAGNVFAFDVPAPKGFVTDTMGILQPGQVKSLSSKISALKASTQNEIGVLVIPSVGDDNIEDITHQTFKAWKIGAAGLDNGVLIVLAINSHKMRIQTGKGVEGDLPDILCSDIQNKMKPFLRTNDVAGALNVAIDNISAKLESRKGQKADDAGAGAQFNKPLPVAPSESATSSSTTPAPRPASCDAGGAGLPSGDGVMVFFLMLVAGVVFGFFWSRSKRQERERLEEESNRRNARLAETNARKAQAAADERALQLARKRRAEELEAQRQSEAPTLPVVVPATPVRRTSADDLRKVLADRAISNVPHVPAIPRPTPKPVPVVKRQTAVAPAVVVPVAAAGLAVAEMELEREQARARREREAELASRREHEEAEARRERERQEREYEARARRERDEEERQARREREEEIAAAAALAAAAAVAYVSYSSDDDSSSSSSSSSSWSDSSSSSDYSSSDSGSSDSGFGGGDSGGGGASSDW